MSGVNKVILVGRLGQDPETKDLNGNTVCNFSVATSEKWNDKTSGELKEVTTWHRVQAWGKLAEVCGKYLAKGRQCYVEGKIINRSYEKDGETKYVTEIKADTVQFLSDSSKQQDVRDEASETHSKQEVGTKPATANGPARKVKNYAPGAEDELGF